MSHSRASRRAGFSTKCGVALFLAAGGSALAQQHIVRRMDIVREPLPIDERQAIETSRLLTEAEAAAFWSIYEDYRAEVAALREQFAAVLDQYSAEDRTGTMTDARAVQLLDEALALDDAELDVRKRIAERLKAAIPGIEATRYLNLANRAQFVVELGLAEEGLLVE